MLPAAVILIIMIGCAHSYLGERYILTRLFHRPLPRLFGSDDFTRKTLRFAWHITTVAWLGFGAILLLVHRGDLSKVSILGVIGITFGISAAIALVASRGRHLSWVFFGLIAAACFLSF